MGESTDRIEVLAANCNKRIREQKATRRMPKEMRHAQCLRASQRTEEARIMPMRSRTSKKETNMTCSLQRPVLCKTISSKVFKKY